jgi:hypothetical protein
VLEAEKLAALSKRKCPVLQQRREELSCPTFGGDFVDKSVLDFDLDQQHFRWRIALSNLALLPKNLSDLEAQLENRVIGALEVV